MSTPASPSSAPSQTDDAIEQVRALATRMGVPPQEFEQLQEAVQRGESFQEFMGLTPEVMASFENVAVAMYSQHRYEEAENIFVLLIKLSQQTRGSAWRGLGACQQVRLEHEAAIESYRRALMADANDLLSATYMAECLMLLGQREQAGALLHALLEHAAFLRKNEEPHVRRAAALLQSLQQPSRTTPMAAGARQPAHARPASDEAQAARKGPADAPRAERLAEDEPSDPALREFMQRPHVRERLEQLAEMFARNQITLRDIADFSQEQIDAGYAICHMLVEQQNWADGLQMCGWMIHIDAHDHRFYQLAGLCALGLQMHCLAEYLFNLSIIWDPHGPDAASLIYKAEAHLLQGEQDEGLRLAAEGLQKARGKAEYKDLAARAELLQKHYGASTAHEPA